MKYLQHNWKSRAFVLLLISTLISLLLITLDQTSWAEQINLQGYSHGGGEGEGEGRSIPTVLRYILPFVKELILIGVPLMLTLLVAKLYRKLSAK